MVETGAVNLTVDMAGQLLAPLGLAVRLHVDSPLVMGRQREPVHALCVGQTRRRLDARDWATAGEVEIVDGRSRGYIDVLAFNPTTRRLLVLEIKTELHDIGQLERTMNWYVRSAPAAARRLGWMPRTVHGAVLLLATEANDQRLHENRVLLARAFPVRARELSALMGGAARSDGLGLAMVDPRSRRKDWLRSTRIDGRRSRAPYLDYGDCLRGRRRGASGAEQSPTSVRAETARSTARLASRARPSRSGQQR